MNRDPALRVRCDVLRSGLLTWARRSKSSLSMRTPSASSQPASLLVQRATAHGQPVTRVVQLRAAAARVRNLDRHSRRIVEYCRVLEGGCVVRSGRGEPTVDDRAWGAGAHERQGKGRSEGERVVGELARLSTAILHAKTRQGVDAHNMQW